MITGGIHYVSLTTKEKEALNFANDIPKEIEIEIEFASSLMMIELAVALARTIRILS
jgi:hypothetical protein